MSSKQEHPIQAMGFWMFGFLSLLLAVLKLTVAEYWSWWRVMLPFLAFLGHNAVYVLAGFLCFYWLNPETMTVSFVEFSPTNDFFDYTASLDARRAFGGSQARGKETLVMAEAGNIPNEVPAMKNHRLNLGVWEIEGLPGQASLTVAD